jgi:hypothetical protein
MILLALLLVPLLGCSISESNGPNTQISSMATAAHTALPPIRMQDFQEVKRLCEQLANESRVRGGIISTILMEQSSSYCDNNYCTVHFSDTQGNDESVFVYVGAGNNTMNRLSSGFSQSDVIVRADDGINLHLGDAIDLVFGTTYHPEYESPCDIYARKLIRL